MLTLETAVPFLRERGLMAERSIVAGRVVVRDVSRRNRAFTVRTDGGAGFFLKQRRPGARPQLLSAEARVYQWLEALPDAPRLRPFLPPWCGFDSASETLILGLVDDSSGLGDLQWMRRRLPARIGAAIGSAVGRLHRVTSAALGRYPADAPPPEASARYLQLHRPTLQTFVQSSAGTMQLIRMIQQSRELSDALDALERGWRPDAVIHADLRLDNFRIRSTEPHGAIGVTIVDWETAGVGDACWDTGTFFGGCLYSWLLSAPITRDSPPQAFVALARLALPPMQPAMRRFWHSYTREIALADEERAERLVRTVRYAGARLVQHAFEEVQRTTRTNALAVYLLQLGLNIMQRPVDAAQRLFGLAVPATEP